MLLYKDIVKENDPVLRKKAEVVNTPLSDEDLKTLLMMDEYLLEGYNPSSPYKKDIRPGVGLAAPQVGVSKQMIVIAAIDEEGEEHHYLIINPKIISHSEELSYLPNGEGCLSVDRDCDGLIMRYKRVKVRCELYHQDEQKLISTELKFKGYLAAVFQHEYDHLQGILFIDRINEKKPHYIPENATPIIFKDNE